MSHLLRVLFPARIRHPIKYACRPINKPTAGERREFFFFVFDSFVFDGSRAEVGKKIDSLFFEKMYTMVFSVD